MITEFRWLKHGDPLPEGWRLADQAVTHHHHYAALIERTPPESPLIDWIEQSAEVAAMKPSISPFPNPQNRLSRSGNGTTGNRVPQS